MSLKEQCSLLNCEKVKQMIIENPDLPLLIFVGEEAWNGQYSYTQVMPNKISCNIEWLTLYNDVWIDEDDAEDNLRDDLCDYPEYVDLNDKEYDEVVKQKLKELEFVQAITIYCFG